MGHFAQLIGRSAELQQVLNAARIVSNTDVTVLIEGDTGTGKELLAQALHNTSPRNAKNFIAINCAALPEALAESQLFGHKKGSFTGADMDHDGFVQQAEGGTLFLDEVGELPLPVQAKLLRFIEYGETQRLGDNKQLKSDVRIIAATNRDLQTQVTNGAFREDLYYRLKIIPLVLPSLQQRVEDIPLLSQYFFSSLAEKHRLPVPSVSKAAVKKMQQYGWPGNIRELRNLCESLLVLLQGKAIEETNLPPHIISYAPQSSGFKLPSTGIKLDELEVDLLNQALHATSGNKSRAAKMLGITRDVFLYRLKKYSIS